MKAENFINQHVGEAKNSVDGNTGSSQKAANTKDEILIVEDDELTRKLMERLLQREFDTDTVSMSNGIEGLEYAKEHIPRLIILDLMLPGMNGFDILKEIRGNSLFEHTKVVLVSAKSRSEDIERGFDLTADEYITKPFQPKEFTARIRNLLKRAA
jgi:two-component system alkaline phosphatase synthesis response regulator PhoP